MVLRLPSRSALLHNFAECRVCSAGRNARPHSQTRIRQECLTHRPPANSYFPSLRVFWRTMTDRTIDTINAPFDATITPPGSKSLTNRALVLASLAYGPCEISNVLFADDTLVMMDCLTRLGFNPRIDRKTSTVRIEGCGGKIPADRADLFCGNSGTTIRFLTALCTLGKGQFNLDGIPRMRQRPIRQLAELLKNLGGRISYVMQDGFPPVIVAADGLPGGLVRFGNSQSSQYLSAVLQIAPFFRNELRVELSDTQTSWPYVAMTMRLMDQFGHTPHVVRDADTGEPRKIIVPIGGYQATNYAVEPDASNAGYFLAAAAIHPGSKVTIPGLGRDSLQGDIGFAEVLRQMGAEAVVGADSISISGPPRLHGIDIDLSGMPDMAQTLAVVALFAEGKTTIRGLHTLRVKETDRIAALSTELGKLGAFVEITGDDLIISPPQLPNPARIATYDDHRMAMSFALAGTRIPNVAIMDPQCVNKTYPDYFADLRKLTENA